MNRRTCLSFVLVPLFAACAAPSPPGPTQSSPGEAEPTRWSGRFSASFPDPQAGGGRGRASGRFIVERNDDGSVLLELASPIGQTMARARAGRDGAELQDSRGRVHRAADDEALTEALFGWRVPVRALPGWLRAGALGEMRAAAPGANPQSVGPSPPVVRADGWSVRVVRAAADRVQVLELEFPGRETDPARRLNLRLVIDSAS